MQIRKALAEDFEGVKALEEEIYMLHSRFRPDYFKGQENSYTRTEYEALLNAPNSIAWIAVKNNEVIGICLGKIEQIKDSALFHPRRFALIEDLAVSEAHQHKGVAQALMAQARAQALQDGAQSIELHVWNFNENAIRFYEKLGFKMQYHRMEERL